MCLEPGNYTELRIKEEEALITIKVSMTVVVILESSSIL